jgi:hypothetical protein
LQTKNDLEKLAQIRLDDAVLLLAQKRSSSAYYLAGYAVELALKAVIAKLVQPNTIPDKAFILATYTHKFDDLLSTAGLRPQFQADVKTDLQFETYWAIASQWTESSRYTIWDSITAATMITAVANPKHGVFRWVKAHW